MPEEMIGYEWKKLNHKLCFPEQSRTRSKNHNLVAKKFEVTFSLGLGDQIIPQYEYCIRLGLDLKCMYLSIQIVARELRGFVIFLQRVYWNVFQFWLDLANILNTSWKPFVSHLNLNEKGTSCNKAQFRLRQQWQRSVRGFAIFNQRWFTMATQLWWV